MTLSSVLETCRSSGVTLRLVAGETRQSGASAELLAELKAHREEMRVVLGSRSWPWLGFSTFSLEEACCACGQAKVWVFTEQGEPCCKLHVQ